MHVLLEAKSTRWAHSFDAPLSVFLPDNVQEIPMEPESTRENWRSAVANVAVLGDPCVNGTWALWQIG